MVWTVSQWGWRPCRPRHLCARRQGPTQTDGIGGGLVAALERVGGADEVVRSWMAVAVGLPAAKRLLHSRCVIFWDKSSAVVETGERFSPWWFPGVEISWFMLPTRL